MLASAMIAQRSTLVDFFGEHQQAMWWGAALSVVLFVGCLIVVPWLVSRIPADYFVGPHRPRTPFAAHHPVLRLLAVIAKNLIGAALIVAGILMLILPGQGVLTVVIGVLLMDFPGKHRLERKLIRQRPVLRSINWLRRRSGVEPIRVEPIPRERKQAIEPSSSDRPLIVSENE